MKKTNTAMKANTSTTSVKRVAARSASKVLARDRKRSKDGGYEPRALTLPDGRVFASLRTIGKGVGVWHGHVSMILRGKRKPSVFLMNRMASFLGVSMDVLYEMLYGAKGIVPKDSPVGKKILAR